MKVTGATANSLSSEYKQAKEHADAILPLRREKDKKLSKDQMISFKLRTDPADNNSPTYEFTTQYITGIEGARAAIQFTKDMGTICTGMNAAADIDRKLTLTRRVLKGAALTAYNSGVDTNRLYRWNTLREAARANSRARGDTEAQQDAAATAVVQPVINDADHETGLAGVIKYMTPEKALQRVKRYLRRHCRKPADMTVMEYFNALQHINNEEIPHLPPFGGAHQVLGDDELIEIIHYGIPNSWKNEMERQGFDALEHVHLGVAPLLEFCRRLESLEDDKPKKDSPSSTKKKARKENRSSGKGSGGGDSYCLIHGKCGHDSNNCRTLKAQVKGESGSKIKNKTWSKKADDSKKASAKALAAFVQKRVQKELNAISEKKRKADSDDDESVNLMEDGELAAFNYEGIENLNLSDKEFEDAVEELSLSDDEDKA